MGLLENLMKKIFGTKHERDIKKIMPIVEEINALEKEYDKLTNEEIRGKTEEFKERIRNGESLDEILPEAFAVVREAAKRTLGMRHFDVQLIGGIVLHQGKIAEMKTGEGKTLVATLALYLNALTGENVHLVTVNDYLARRDATWMGPIYLFLGISVGVINPNGKSYVVVWKDEKKATEAIRRDLRAWPKGNYTNDILPEEMINKDVVEMFQTVLKECTRKEAYMADITYGTNNEFGFDYLRDNMVFNYEDKVQRGHFYAIVDEVDSVLIDEARTPLIISGPAIGSIKIYKQADRIVPKLKEVEYDPETKQPLEDTGDYVIDEKTKNAYLTERGMKRLEELWGKDLSDPRDPRNLEIVHAVIQSIRAHKLFHKDVDYMVINDEVVIIDEFTGRLMYGRRWSDGLHQAIEAKEGVPVRRENQTLATITFQNYFRMYKKLAGMTGTAETEAEEFWKIYKLDVVVIPTHKPVIRIDYPDRVYMTEKEKFEAIVKEIKELHKIGRPVLVGTTSVEKSEILSKMLRKEGIPHQVLNAKYHEKEAQIIARAGEKGAVTVATNMAGRGVDIKLGPGVKELGGLHVIGSERHEARRIDNQLRGRAGRQGDPGSSRFYVSLEDELMRLFGGQQIQSMMKRLGWKYGEEIEHPLISRAIENAQKRVEKHNFEIRKYLLEYDDVMNRQRQYVYSLRDQILLAKDYKNILKELVKNIAINILKREDLEKYVPSYSEISQIIEYMSNITNYPIKLEIVSRKAIEWVDTITDVLYEEIQKRLSSLPEEIKKDLFKWVMLNILDQKWREHLYVIDEIKEGIHLRAYGEKNPLVEFKIEAFNIFEEMLVNTAKDILSMLFKIKVEVPKVAEGPKEFVVPEVQVQYIHKEYGQFEVLEGTTVSGDGTEGMKPIRREKPKLNPNDPCWCGSGKKYKHCHMQYDLAQERAKLGILKVSKTKK